MMVAQIMTDNSKEGQSIRTQQLTRTKEQEFTKGNLCQCM